jgi:dipeptidyl aminopeptidase/acylaminoacyl peptidase
MKKKAILIVCLFVQFCFSQKASNEYTLTQRYPKDFPIYTKLTSLVGTNLILKPEYNYVDSLNFYGLDYKSFDNLKIRGFLIEPKKKGIYPVLIFNRGGNGNFGTVSMGDMATYLGVIGSKGYVIIGSQLRGNTVSEGFDEFGGKDVQDVLSLFPIIDQLVNVDKARIGVWGWSRGVMTNFLMLKKTNRIKTNIAIAGQADLLRMDRPEMFRVYSQRIPGYAKDSVAALLTRSSLLAIDSIANKKTTHFIIQGNKDVRVNIKNAFVFYDKLNASNFTTRLKIYENEGHGLEGVTENLTNEIEDWLKRYL